MPKGQSKEPGWQYQETGMSIPVLSTWNNQLSVYDLVRKASKRQDLLLVYGEGQQQVSPLCSPRNIFSYLDVDQNYWPDEIKTWLTFPNVMKKDTYVRAVGLARCASCGIVDVVTRTKSGPISNIFRPNVMFHNQHTGEWYQDRLESVFHNTWHYEYKYAVTKKVDDRWVREEHVKQDCIQGTQCSLCYSLQKGLAGGLDFYFGRVVHCLGSPITGDFGAVRSFEPWSKPQYTAFHQQLAQNLSLIHI